MSVKRQDRYRQLCIDEPTIPLFSQAWWLDATAENQWDVLLVESGDRIDAAMPICMDRKFGFNRIFQPPFTQTLGPWIREVKGRNFDRQAKEFKCMGALIKQLPPFDVFKQNFHPSITNWLPFYWHGFKQTTRYTYILDNLSDTEKLWTSLRSNIRTDIKKASGRNGLTVRTDRPFSTLIDLYRMTYARQGLPPRQQESTLKRIHAASSAQECCNLFIAEDAHGKPHAAAYVVWDKNRAYYLIGGSNPDLRNSGAASLCLWKAIEFTHTVAPIFDFEGSMHQPIERFFRAFGTTPIPYHQITLNRSRIYDLAHSLLLKR